MEKTKVYLDTNMLLDLFVAQIRAEKEEREAIPPKKFQSLMAFEESFEYLTSVLTKAEITRELVSGFHLSASEVDALWGRNLSKLECRYIGEFMVSGDLIGIVSRIAMRLRTMLNFLHVFIAVKEGAYFVSGDKDIARRIRDSGISAQALSYPELCQFAASVARGDTLQPSGG